MIGKIYPDLTVHYILPIQSFLDKFCNRDLVEDDDYSAKRFERAPCVDGSVLIDSVT